MNEHGAKQLEPWLPEGCVEVERVDDVVDAAGARLHRAGTCVRTPSGEHVTGSAAGRERAPMARARFEVLERCALLEAIGGDAARHVVRAEDGRATGIVQRAALFPESDDPEVWRFARSNGVALHDDWRRACERAYWELCERDRVLRAWLGEIVPQPLEVRGEAAVWSGLSGYAFRAARFGDDGAGIPVAGVFGFPEAASAPLVVGYAARPSLADAITAAGREAIQNLAFLWGEVLPSEPPRPGPTPVHHVDHLLWPGSHAVLAAWLDRGHARHVRHGGATPAALGASVGFVDLTPPWLAGRGRVCKAIAEGALPLAFGADPRLAHLPPALRVHPIG